MTEEKVTSTYFATVYNGKVAVLGQAFPPHELLDCQIVLTEEEYKILRALEGKVDLEKAFNVIKAVETKIKSNGS